MPANVQHTKTPHDMDATDYLQLQLTPAARAEFAAAMHSWRTMHPEIRSFPDSNESLTKLATMVALELTRDPPRHQILARLHMRINAMRQRMELASIGEAAGITFASQVSKPRAAKRAKRVKKVPTPTEA